MNRFIERLAGIQTKQRWALVLGVVAAVFLIFFMVSYKKSQQKLTDIVTTIESTRPKVQRLQAIERKLPRFNADLAKLKSRLEISKRLLPEKKEIPELLTKLSMLGSEAGLEFVSFQPGPERRQLFYAEVPVAITVRGGYHEMARFLDDIRTLRRIVHVRNLRLGGANVGGGLVTLNARCTLVTYRFLSRDEEEATARTTRGRRR